MKQRPLSHNVTLFVCTCERGKKRDCCARFGSKKTLARLKKRVKERKLQDEVRILPSGCMGKCSKGPNVLSFPDNTWSRRVAASDADELLDQVAPGLRAPDEPHEPDS